tara:strand:- start:367 stop:825 length:459 start_codon:yes stop_codon:yes gene_type:complete
MNVDQLIEAINKEEFDGDEYSTSVLLAIRERCSTLNDFVTLSSYFFEDPKNFDHTLIKKHCKSETYGHLTVLKSHLNELKEWSQISVKQSIDETAAELDVGFGKVGLPLRLALTASVNSPSIDLVCEILGKDNVLRRLDNFLGVIKSQEIDL